MDIDRVHVIAADARTYAVTGNDTVDYAPPALPYARTYHVEEE